MSKPREFWIESKDCDFDLNWKQVFVAEHPHKDTIDDAIHVIEYSAYEELLNLVDESADSVRRAADNIEALRKERDEYRAALERLKSGDILPSFATSVLAKYPKDSK